ncbi:60S ribosomal protein L7a [Culex quinquefasciatus]|uniref:60S ribosomal protein L7a n=1 Tax=Culex quinquefasciatus TaxID=7176 RepID=B0WTB8_CULQU|nr:60S ribosomal protein L7a [Culex quinquefasciatus]|eukprot:XP_001853752.1 60S ribosomal protein L7a [Culex quinquefasciatus]
MVDKKSTKNKVAGKKVAAVRESHQNLRNRPESANQARPVPVHAGRAHRQQLFKLLKNFCPENPFVKLQRQKAEAKIADKEAPPAS